MNLEAFEKRKQKIFEEEVKPTCLYLLPTPLGNLGDITLRTLYFLEAVDVLACEDTRTTGILLQAFGLTNHTIAYHQHNQEQAIPKILSYLEEGKSVGLCTDAGTPAISDPGQALVQACHSAGFSVSSLPGACAAITALSGSGLPSYQFTFVGFLSKDKKEAWQSLKKLIDREESLIFYEAPHRLKSSLSLLCEAGYAERKIVLARELTKLHEQWYLSSVQDLLERVETEAFKGEIVFVLEGKTQNQNEEEIDFETYKKDFLALLEQYRFKQAVQKLSEEKGLSKNRLYQEALKWKEESREL